MTTEPREPGEWEVLQTYDTVPAAEVDAGYLRGEGVAAEVRPMGDIPGTGGARLMVDAKLAHRARWLLKLEAVSDAELEYLATGSLAPVEESIPQVKRPRTSVWLVAAVLLVVALLAIAHIAGNVAI